ncbi:uncharacterized protein LOC123533672 isoform X2 [Mercenaria mercenaria]|uniref:uncharacterized protein LOC123533672 isoform X2 n=1 Tax=Mercenaria mercenaria TaxID=6596 RepID=UPI00234F289F|nr:uncharacterized protein LOC123533672 isoform X2 [Mercenaria mercenaria]
MKFIYLTIIFSVSTATVSTQDPPPAIDLPPPPPFDLSPEADIPADPPASIESNTSTVSRNNDSTATNETVNDAPVLDTIESAPINVSSSGSNGSVIVLPEPSTPSDKFDISGANETIVANVTDGITDNNVSDTSTSISSVKSVANDTEIVNMTDIAATDQAISDILAAAAGNDTVSNNTNVVTDNKYDNLTSNESLDNITAIETQNVSASEPPLTPADTPADRSLTLSLDEFIVPLSDPLSDPLSETAPVDLPPPPIAFDPGLESEFAVSDIGTNVSDISSLPDFNITSPTDTNDTIAINKTYIDPVDIHIGDTGNMSIEHTHLKTDSPVPTTVQIPVDLPAIPEPVDLPPPPIDTPSVDFIDAPGSTTIEISDLLAGLGTLDGSSPPMDSVVPETTTTEMTPEQYNVPTTVPAYETTTVIPYDVFTSPTAFVEYDTTTTQPVLDTKDPIYKHVPEKGETLTLDHPPPIFSGGSRPSVYTDPYGPHDGHFPYPETTTPKVVTTTKEAPPPPIKVPTRPDRRTNWPVQRFETTASPYARWTTQMPLHQTTLSPRHMNVAELAAYALRMSNNRKFTNQPFQGIQVFFQADPETTTLKPTTTLKSVYKQQNKGIQKDMRSNSFVEYLRKKYGISNIGTTHSYYATTAKPTMKPLQLPSQRKFYDAQYLLSHLPESTTQKPTMKNSFDSRYLLSHLDISPTKPVVPKFYASTIKPTTARHFYDAKYLLSHLDEIQRPNGNSQSTLPPKPSVTKLSQNLPQPANLPRRKNVPGALQTWMNNINVKPNAVSEFGSQQEHGRLILKEQRQGQVDTRPINLKSNISPQSVLNYNVNPERNVRMNINLKPNINQWGGQQKTSNPYKSLTTASFKPVVYGNKPFQIKKQSPGLSLRERFNRKWYHPEAKTTAKGTVSTRASQAKHEPIKNINIQIEEPINRNQVKTEPISPVNTLFNRRGLHQNVNSALQGPVTNRDMAIQRTSIELQRQIIKQQEEKLRQQQQQLQKQQAVFRLQQEQRKKQLQKQSKTLPVSQQYRLALIQQQQKENQNLLLQQQEQERLRLLQLQQKQNNKLLLQQQEQDRLRLLEQQQKQAQLRQQLILRQQEEQRSRLLQQQQQQNQKLLLKQQEQDRSSQQELQRRLLLNQQRQREQELLRQQQFSGQSNQFPLASRIGHSEIIRNNQISKMQHRYQPNVQVSSIQIFKAPAMMRRRKNQERKEAMPQPTQTHWRAPSDLQHLHGHLSVPYKLDPIPAPQTTQATPKSAVPVITTPTTVVYIQTIATTVRPVTSSPRPTLPATADPNPPPIFDTKVRHTFMPMPNIEPTTKAPKPTGDDTQVHNQQNNLQIDERCKGCVFVNDRCLLPDPVHCHFYIECVKQGTSVRAFSRECALGSFFDRKSFLCVDPKNADCPTDRCRIPGTKWYAIHGHCKHYWSCGAREGGGVFAQSECCPQMGGFVEPVGCVENPNCTDTCSSTIIKEGPTGLTNCTCSNETSCSCSGAMQATARVASCLPMLSLTFDGGSMVDSSNTKQHVGVDGVSATMEGEAIYNGGGKLVLWRYANLMFPVVFAIRFRFYSTTPSPRKQIIFSNCNPKGGQEPSIEIALDTMFSEVVFKINTYKGPSKRFTIIYQPSKWTNVDFIYDGERIVGSVDRRARNIFAGGGIETRPNPIGIGSCSGKDGFKGLLDDISIYEECIPDEMYGIFMSVLE